jgi:hypothetical protein
MPTMLGDTDLWIPARLRSWIVRLRRKWHEIARFIISVPGVRPGIFTFGILRRENCAIFFQFSRPDTGFRKTPDSMIAVIFLNTLSEMVQGQEVHQLRENGFARIHQPFPFLMKWKG